MGEAFNLNDLTAYHHAPRHARKFAQMLLQYNAPTIDLSLNGLTYIGTRKTVSNIQFAYEPFQLLGSQLTFVFMIEGQTLELSLQFYENNDHYWRLYCFTKYNGQVGLGCSTNVTLGTVEDGIYMLKHHVHLLELAAQQNPFVIRQKKQLAYAHTLYEQDLLFMNEDYIYLATFSTLSNKGFLDIPIEQFIRQVLIISLIKSHYVASNGFSLSFLPPIHTFSEQTL